MYDIVSEVKTGQMSLFGSSDAIEYDHSKVRGNRATPKLIRYADDFVIIFDNREVIEQAKEAICKWLEGVGLEMKEAKTKIVCATEGFDFLGFNVRQFPRTLNNKKLKAIIQPSKKSIRKHNLAVKDTLRRTTTAPQESVVKTLNPIIRGWANYFRTSSARKTFESCDDIMNHQLRRWVERRHHSGKRGYRKSSYRKYFKTIRGNAWRFVTEENYFLMMHTEHKINYHRMVARNRSPYDGDTIYWATRLGRSMEIAPRMAKLLKEQKGRCKRCFVPFDHEAIMEVHHVDGNHKNAKWDNLELIHGHCHDNAHGPKSTDDKSHIAEEPCDMKASSTVLK